MMGTRPLLRSLRLAAFALLAGSGASAIAAGPVEYHCNGDGVSWTSNRPCPGTNRNEMRALGSGPQTPSYDASSWPSLGKAPEYLPYMSVECAQLNDAIRTGPARGLKSGPMSELQADYQKRCREDEASARKQLQEAEKQQRDRRLDQQAAAEAEKSRAVLSSEQCYEMLRILHGKRQRVVSMTDGEKADLQRFEDNYKARCPRR